MNNQGKQLEVRLYGRKVGTLRPTSRNGLVFQYDKDYVESPEAVPLGTRSALNERPWTPTLTRTWFEGLLPEGARRATLAQALGTVNVDTWTLLELAGDECAGAVQVVAPDHTENPRLFELDDDALETLLQPPTTWDAESGWKTIRRGGHRESPSGCSKRWSVARVTGSNRGRFRYTRSSYAP